MRIRSIKPQFFRHEQMTELDYKTRLFFIGLLCCADREGRLEDRPKRLASEIFPYEQTDAELHLAKLADAGFIIRYRSADGMERFIAIPKFSKHQRISGSEAQYPSVIPPPPEGKQLGSNLEAQRKQLGSTKEAQEKQGGSNLEAVRGFLGPLKDRVLSMNDEGLGIEQGGAGGASGEAEFAPKTTPAETLDLALECDPAPEAKPTKRTKPPETAIEAAFNEFWQLYPPMRREGKGGARIAYAKACSKASPESINAAAAEYRKCIDSWKAEDQKYVPMPSRWLNDERFSDGGDAIRARMVSRDSYDDSGATH